LQLFMQHGIERAKLSRLKSVSEIQRWLRLMLRLGSISTATTHRTWPAPVPRSVASRSRIICQVLSLLIACAVTSAGDRHGGMAL
jgi:hypothetical protein